jgi:hypothetical protein
LYQRAVDSEVLLAQQTLGMRLLDHRQQQPFGHFATQQALAVLGEHCHIPDRIVHVEPHEPAEQQVVI